jgi:hypothetical protein
MMDDIGGYIWIFVVIFVVVTRILPRLFRGKRSGESEVPTGRRPQAAKPAEMNGGPVTDFDTLISTLKEKRFAPQGQSDAPPPIEPK